jgi:hypothetical protein
MSTTLYEEPEVEVAPENMLDHLRTLAKLDGEREVRKFGEEYAAQVQRKLFQDLDAKITEAFDALDLGLSAERHSYLRKDCVILECCTGTSPYVKGFIGIQKIPAFDLSPPTPKKATLSSALVARAFSAAVDNIPTQWGYAHPAALHPGVPLSFYLMNRTDVTFYKPETE